MWIITVSVDLSRFQAKSKSLAATEASSAGEASLSAEPPKDYCRVLVQGEFTVGRQTARRAGREPPLIEISGDKGVSRQQGVLVVSGNYDVRNALARSVRSHIGLAHCDCCAIWFSHSCGLLLLSCSRHGYSWQCRHTKVLFCYLCNCTCE